MKDKGLIENQGGFPASIPWIRKPILEDPQLSVRYQYLSLLVLVGERVGHQGTNISPKKWHFEDDFPNFPRWDMLIPWRVGHPTLLKSPIFVLYRPCLLRRWNEVYNEP